MQKRKSLKDRINNLSATEWEIKRAFDLLPIVKQAIGGKGRVYANVTSVASSGMSRTIELLIVHPKTKEIINLNNTAFYRVYGDSKNRDGAVRIGGCGMDMLFEATYRLYQFLFNQATKPYQKSLNEYRQY